jgi:late competence protein required for DNA uptake (superfamily II DNA/RNA helicase)
MATIDIYIRTQSKTKSLVNVRYRLREKLVVLNYTSDIEIPPKIWDAKKQNIKNTNLVDSEDKIRLEKLISDRKTLILSIGIGAYTD